MECAAADWRSTKVSCLLVVSSWARFACGKGDEYSTSPVLTALGLELASRFMTATRECRKSIDPELGFALNFPFGVDFRFERRFESAIPFDPNLKPDLDNPRPEFVLPLRPVFTTQAR